jgi:hypothetical protein
MVKSYWILARWDVHILANQVSRLVLEIRSMARTHEYPRRETLEVHNGGLSTACTVLLRVA